MSPDRGDSAASPATVVLTRPAGQAGAERAALEAAGVHVVELPAIVIEPAADPAVLDDVQHRIGSFDLIHFASINAVESLVRAAPGWTDAILKRGARIASMGTGTRAALKRCWPESEPAWFDADATPAIDSETLLQRLLDKRVGLTRVLLIKGEGGRSWLGDQLQRQGSVVEPVSVYRRRRPRLTPGEVEAFTASLEGSVCLVVSSSEAAANLAAMLDGIGPATAGWRHWTVIASHSRIAASLEALGCEHVVRVAPGIDKLVQTVKSMPRP